MGGEIDWNAVGPVAEMLGIEDPALLVHGLTHVRNHFRRQEESERR